MIQDNIDQRLFTFDLNENYDLIADHKLKVDVTSASYPTQIPAFTLEVDIIVENPCLDTDLRKFVDVFNTTEIIFPIGSKSIDKTVSWTDSIDFSKTANLTKACGPPNFQVIHPSILNARDLVKDDSKSGVILSLPRLEDKPKFS